MAGKEMSSEASSRLCLGSASESERRGWLLRISLCKVKVLFLLLCDRDQSFFLEGKEADYYLLTRPIYLIKYITFKNNINTPTFCSLLLQNSDAFIMVLLSPLSWVLGVEGSGKKKAARSIINDD